MPHQFNRGIVRALAVSTLLIDHLLPTMTHYLTYTDTAVLRYAKHIGHTWVIAFTVHRSFVLTGSLERLHAKHEHVAWRFYVRRFYGSIISPSSRLYWCSP